MDSVTLQDRMNGSVRLQRWAGFAEDGAFEISGCDVDLGERDFEYEWTTRVEATAVPALCALLGASSPADLLDVLRRDWVPVEGEGLEAAIRASDVPSSLFVA